MVQDISNTESEWFVEESSNDMDFMLRSKKEVHPIVMTCEEGLAERYRNKLLAKNNMKSIAVAVNATYGQGINPDSIPLILKENASLKSKLESYSKDYKEMGDIVVKLQGELDEMKRSFYMDICRAYNAGKECMNNQHEDARNKGAEAFSDRFVSSHDYFLSEFTEFKTNVP